MQASGTDIRHFYTAPGTPPGALNVGHAIGAQLVKFSLDIKRPKPIYGSCMHPDVVVELADRVNEFKKNIPLIENYGMKIALENHCDLFADEVWA
jgi:3-oxoisoapionate decarboxylase